jgi:hypothetical protein
MGVHLLACMLARDWDGTTATAIWVELVERRSIEILSGLQQNYNISGESVTAARQDFSRRELEEWDLSARSWLGQADKALAVQRDQFLLIAKNVSLSIGNNKDPYTNVIRAWTHAMMTLERHLEGISQQISDGAVLKAISAWHLYPDLAHFGRGANQVAFSDPLFPKPAIMTLGLTEVACDQKSRGIHWSLALSHLRYYGDAVSVESVEDRTRATLSQFQVIILGAVLEAWRVRRDEQLDAIRWIHEFWGYLKKTAPAETFDMTLSGHTSWLLVLAQAADLVLSAAGSELERYQDYLNHGEHWGSGFLMNEEESQALQPYFGLCNQMLMASMEEPLDVDAGIEMLRQLARNMGLREQDAIIYYSEQKGPQSYVEYCTAVPHLNSTGTKVHARWIKIINGPTSTRLCYHKCHSVGGCTTPPYEIDLDFRLKMVQARSEACFTMAENSLFERTISVPNTSKRAPRLIWKHSVPLYRDGNDFLVCPCSESAHDGTPCNCLTPPDSSIFDPHHDTHFPDAAFDLCFKTFAIEGQLGHFELYLRVTSMDQHKFKFEEKMVEAASLKVKPSQGMMWLKSSRPQPNRVWDYIQSLTLPAPKIQSQLIMRESIRTPDGLDWEFSHGRTANLINRLISPPPQQWIRSLELMNVVSEIYQGLPGATISLGVLDYPLGHNYWTALDSVTHLPSILPRRRREFRFGAGELLREMRRQEIFSCIALMETGTSNIQPDALKEVMAMSFRNSIFVAGTLLSDPYESVSANNVRHIVGNVGFAGLNLMVSPVGPLKIQPPANEVQHGSLRSNFDAERPNKFHGTSLHLSFTGQRFPLVLTDIDTIGQGIFYLQSVVSLWDNGKHLADLDLLGIEKDHVTRITLNCSCTVPQLLPEDYDIRCLDSWQEVLRPPRRMSIIRSHKNWPVRLAAVSLLLQQQKGHSLGILSSEVLCWRCLETRFQDPEPHLPQILID